MTFSLSKARELAEPHASISLNGPGISRELLREAIDILADAREYVDQLRYLAIQQQDWSKKMECEEWLAKIID